MTIFASCDYSPAHFLITVFEKKDCDFVLMDSIFVPSPWTQEEINDSLEKIKEKYHIDKWVTADEKIQALEMSRIF